MLKIIFTATQVLSEIKFLVYHMVKNVILGNNTGSEFWF